MPDASSKSMPVADVATAPPSQHVSGLVDGYEISPTVVTAALGDRPDDMDLPPAHMDYMDSVSSFAALAGSPKLADRRRKLSNPELKVQPGKEARKCRGGVAPAIVRRPISLGPSAAEVRIRIRVRARARATVRVRVRIRVRVQISLGPSAAEVRGQSTLSEPEPEPEPEPETEPEPEPSPDSNPATAPYPHPSPYPSPRPHPNQANSSPRSRRRSSSASAGAREQRQVPP